MVRYEKRAGTCPLVEVLTPVSVTVAISNDEIVGVSCPMYNADVPCSHVACDQRCGLFPEYGVSENVRPTV